MEYEINFESRETFLNFLKNVEDIEKNYLFICTYLVDNNDVNFIIDELLKFKKIRLYLDFCHSNITIIPKTVYSLKNLVFLNLSHNYINNISISICKLQKLRTIFINDNNFFNYPYIICDLQNLSNIYVVKTRLIFRLYFLIHKNFLKLNYKILKKLIKY